MAVGLTCMALDLPVWRISGYLPNCNKDQLQLRGSNQSQMGVGFVGLQAHVANTDDVHKPRTLVREGKGKTPKKDPLRLGSSSHR